MTSPLRARSSNEIDHFAPAHEYYGPSQEKRHLRARTFSTNHTEDTSTALLRSTLKTPIRRGSHDERSLGLDVAFDLPVEKTIAGLLVQADANENYQITRDSSGNAMTIWLGTAGSNGNVQFNLRGTYLISNLMQELHLAKQHGHSMAHITYERLTEDPVHRLLRLIKAEFWDNLTRRIDSSNIQKAAVDPKDWTENPQPRIYIPRGAPEQFAYYQQIAKDLPKFNLDVCWLPEVITSDAVRDLNSKPGLLALAMEETVNPVTSVKELKGLPFVVPGGRFNELYGWDSYMESLGLIASGRVDLARAMVQHFIFSIKHYGKILNANRSYYLSRSQPPFLTDMAMRVYEVIKNEPGAVDFLKQAILAAIKEYHTVWMTHPRLDPVTGLSRYRPEGRGVPPETEASHFTHLLEPYAKKHNMEFKEFVEAYNTGEIVEPDLDEYFLHDRAVRESGHDTSYRLEKVCANLATIDLNSLLYKYETDIAMCIRKHFKDSLEVPAEFCVGDAKPYRENSAAWDRRAKLRRARVDKYLWNSNRGLYFDYDTVKKQQCTYETATTFWALWSGLATPPQAAKLVESAIPLFEKAGGLVSGTEESRGVIGLDRPNRQWDYPYGWAPQQILAWEGLRRYGYDAVLERLAYRWILMMTSCFVDFHGTVVEKYDVTVKIAPHKVEAEYGNQGTNFKGVAREGFGWVNASYVLGHDFLNTKMRQCISQLVPWEDYVKSEMHRIPEEIEAEAVFENAD